MRNISNADRPTTPDAGPDRALRILIAEDNHINQKIIAAMIAPLNCQFDMVENGLEAVEAVAGSDYDVVLMDINMPGMDGIAAAQKIRTLPGAAAGIPIIAVTANTVMGDRQKYMEAGMNDHVPKPIIQQGLLSAITRWANTAIQAADLPAASGNSLDIANDPLSGEAEEELKNIMGDLDGLLDESGQ